MERDELLMWEYETVVNQIIHWDAHFWRKSEFFLIAESALLAAVAQRLITEFSDMMTMGTNLLYAVVVLVIFNIFLCYVWFRTNRSNREYLKLRFDRMLQIEDQLKEKEVAQMFHWQLERFGMMDLKKHSSSSWEVHLPTGFMLIWFTILSAAIFDSGPGAQAILAGIALVVVICVIGLVERTGWPIRDRSAIYHHTYEK